MNKSDLIAEKVFKSINNVMSTVENIHGDIVERKGDKNEKALHREEKRARVYGLIRSINGRVEGAVRDFLK